MQFVSIEDKILVFPLLLEALGFKSPLTTVHGLQAL